MFTCIQQFHMDITFNISHTCAANIMQHWEGIQDNNIQYDPQRRRLTGPEWFAEITQSQSEHLWFLAYKGIVNEDDHDIPCAHIQETEDGKIWIIAHPHDLDISLLHTFTKAPLLTLPENCTKHQAVLQKVVFEYHSNDTIGSDQA